MFTKIIQSVLMKHVGKYLNEVEENSFDVGLIDGDILIENVGLNNKLFEELNLPITLKFSNIDRLSIKVPWTRLDK
jgi:vacuolar protein sorting-associated protein 13A/C